MIRELSNKIFGRIKTLEESIELDQAIDYIKTIDIERLKKIKFNMAFYVIGIYSLKKPNPKKVAEFLEDCLVTGTHAPQSEGDFIRVTREVFSNKYGAEKHYLDIVSGNKESFPGFVGHIKYILKSNQ